MHKGFVQKWSSKCCIESKYIEQYRSNRVCVYSLDLNFMNTGIHFVVRVLLLCMYKLYLKQKNNAGSLVSYLNFVCALDYRNKIMLNQFNIKGANLHHKRWLRVFVSLIKHESVCNVCMVSDSFFFFLFFWALVCKPLSGKKIV